MLPAAHVRSVGALLTVLLSTSLLWSWKDASSRQLVNRQASFEAAVLVNSSTSKHAIPHFGRHNHPLSDHGHLHPTHSINKRARTLDYDSAACTGKVLYREILAGFEGTADPGRIFPEDELENGWVRSNEQGGLDDGWDAVFKEMGKYLSIGARVATEEESLRVDLNLFRQFTNAAGGLVSGNDVERTAHFDIAYIPTFKAIVALHVRSPRYQVTQRLRTLSKPSTKADVDRLIPPLNRFSDVMWTIWSTLPFPQGSRPSDLRYILHSDVHNEDTRGVMADIFRKKRPDGQAVGWPGLYFCIDSEGGQALLGTPNGYGTAYLLIDRARELGRRIPAVTIFTPDAGKGGEDEIFRMLWDLRPLTPTSSIRAGPRPTTSASASKTRST